MKLLCYFLLIGFCFLSCKNKKVEQNSIYETKIKCSENDCAGTYTGPEFENGSDIAHQFSNKMANAVGNKLKELYKKETYRKVDFTGIEMATEGMGSGVVVFKLFIPFIVVADKCSAYTSFDHVGGWKHAPALKKRKQELQNAVMDGHSLFISDLKQTPEGLQEYWFQWKNKDLQAGCK